MTDERTGGSEGAFDRRSFMRKAAVGAFVVPAIASFKLDSLARAGDFRGGHGYPNQTYPNQAPNQCYPNQTFPNQTVPEPHRPWWLPPRR